MVRLISLLLALLPALTIAANETLNYKITYKWGLIHKQAGRATFTTRNDGSLMHATMIARTEPWADRIFKVRDTLLTTITVADHLPVSYRRIAHEDGRYACDILSFTREGYTSKAHCTRIRRGKKESTDTRSEITLEAQGPAVDLLSSFYYLRSLDFSDMFQGQSIRINIFSGKRKEFLTITYLGIEDIKLDGKTYQTYKISFRFTSEGKKKTSEPIDAWLSTEPSRIPLKIVGEVKIGKVQCLYIP